MKNWFLNFFKLSNWKKWLIVSLTILLAILTIGLSTPLYLKNNLKTTSDLSNGKEVIIQVQDPNSLEPVDDKTTNLVLKNISNRLGGQDDNPITIINEKNGFIRITRSDNTFETDKTSIEDFEKEISEKINLTFTSTNGATLFTNNGEFNNSVSTDSPINSLDDFSKFTPPFIENSARVGNDNSITIDLTLSGTNAWSLATQYISSLQDSTNTQLNQRVAMWINLDQLIQKYENTTEYNNASQNPYNFVFENENPNGESSTLKTSPFNASDFLISNQQISAQSNDSSITITGDFSRIRAQQIAAEINYLTSTNYLIKQISSNIINTSTFVGNTIFSPILIAMIVILVLIAFVMVINYGVLGIVQTITFALFLTLIMTVFAALNSVLSPISIAGLIIALGVLLNASISIFDNLKQEVYEGDGIQKAIKKVFSTKWFGIFDTQIILLILSILTFYIGTTNFQEISLIMSISFGFILFCTLFFNRIIATLIVRTNKFDNKLYLLGIRKKYIKNDNYVSKFYSYNYLKNAKWFSISIIIFIFIGILVFSILAGVWKSSSLALNADFYFSGGSALNIFGNSINFEQANQIKNILITEGFSASDIVINNIGNALETNYVVFLNSKTLISNEAILSIQNSLSSLNLPSLSNNLFTYSVSNALNLLIISIYSIAIALFLVFIYVIFRYKWTLALSLILTLIQDSITLFSIFVIFRLEFSNIFSFVWLAIILYSLNDKMGLIIKYSDVFRLYSGEKQTNELLAKNINIAASMISKKTFISFASIIIIISVFFGFTQNAFLVQNSALILGISATLISTIFTQSWLINKFEKIRLKNQNKRIKKDYWKTDEVSEQYFLGINNFEP